MKRLNSLYKKLISESENEGSDNGELVQSPSDSSEQLMDPGSRFAPFNTWDSIPHHLFHPYDQIQPYNFDNNPSRTSWQFLGRNANGTYQFYYRGNLYIYLIAWDPSTNNWTLTSKPIIIDDGQLGRVLDQFDGPGETWPEGQYGPPYGEGIISDFGEYIYISSTERYYKWDSDVGRYLPIEASEIPEGFNPNSYRYDPSIYNLNGELRGIDWWRDRYMPWWSLRYEKPQPSILQTIYQNTINRPILWNPSW